MSLPDPTDYELLKFIQQCSWILAYCIWQWLNFQCVFGFTCMLSGTTSNPDHWHMWGLDSILKSELFCHHLKGPHTNLSLFLSHFPHLFYSYHVLSTHSSHQGFGVHWWWAGNGAAKSMPHQIPTGMMEQHQNPVEVTLLTQGETLGDRKHVLVYATCSTVRAPWMFRSVANKSILGVGKPSPSSFRALPLS